jgi:hypothetical protein
MQVRSDPLVLKVWHTGTNLHRFLLSPCLPSNGGAWIRMGSSGVVSRSSATPSALHDASSDQAEPRRILDSLAGTEDQGKKRHTCQGWSQARL